MSSGTVVRVRGSVTEMSGTSDRAPIVTLSRREVSVTTQNCETSDPDPPVVGTITIGGSGPVTFPTPAYSAISAPGLPAPDAAPGPPPPVVEPIPMGGRGPVPSPTPAYSAISAPGLPAPDAAPGPPAPGPPA